MCVLRLIYNFVKYSSLRAVVKLLSYDDKIEFLCNFVMKDVIIVLNVLFCCPCSFQ